jgi:hypothetical protein
VVPCAMSQGTSVRMSLADRCRLQAIVPSPIASQEAIKRFVREHIEHPRPFVWTVGPDAIVEKVRRGHHALGSTEQWAG